MRYSKLLIIVLLFILRVSSLTAGQFKQVRIGPLWDKIWDNTARSQRSTSYYYDNFGAEAPTMSEGWVLGCKNWTDEQGNFYPIFIAGTADAEAVSEGQEIFILEDELGRTMVRYMRYQPPSITVDGFPLNDPFPFDESDEVNPEAIPGTADMMIESRVRTHMGMDLRQRVFAWSQHNHDDYMLFEFTFYNTGNVDFDEDIELPNQTLEDVYIYKQMRVKINYTGYAWSGHYGESPGDSLRIMYGYPARTEGADYDNFGNPNIATGYLGYPEWSGLVTTWVDSSTTNHTYDDLSQPQMTGNCDVNLNWARTDATGSSPAEWALLYEVMQYSFHNFYGTPYMTGTYPGTYHELAFEDWDLQFVRESNIDRPRMANSYGPYTFEPGDSLKIIYAVVVGSISPQTSWKIGKDWVDGTCTWDGPDNLEEYYPAFGRYPSLASTENDKAKDRWVCTGKDSLYKNAIAAIFATRNGYNVPIPPPPPSIQVTGKPNNIVVEWGNESESTSDFAGYRIYRAEGGTHYSEEGGIVTGDWQLLFECGEGTGNSLTHTYEDTDAERGKAYYYYVTAFDDGSNAPGVNDTSEVLESGKWLNMTLQAVHLTRPPGEELSEIRVVPNPFSVTAREIQYPGESDKIMFLNLPPECTIEIYNESLDLVKIIEHIDGSGDEAWADPTGQNFMVTSEGQIPVSGLYIAQIKTPDGRSTNVKFLIIR